MSSEHPRTSAGDIDRRLSYVFGPFRFTPAEYRLEQKGGGPTSLTAKERDLLLFLVKNHQRVISREEIFDAVWQQVVEDNVLTAQIKNLRELMGDTAKGSKYLETLPGRGIRFCIDVQEDWIDAEVQAKRRPVAPARGSKDVTSTGTGGSWIADLAGEWHAIWETTAHHELNINHEVVAISQDGATIVLENLAASPENKDGGYLWEARLSIHDNRHLVGAYWSIERPVNARGTLYLVLNPTGRYLIGIWVGCNIDNDLACGRVALSRSEEDASAEFKRLTNPKTSSQRVGSPLFGESQKGANS